MPETNIAGDTQTLRDLEQRVRDTIKQRTDIERQLANPDTLRSAAARAYRDRDAVTSPLLEEARDKVAADIAELHKQWRDIDRTARDIDRIHDLLDDAPDHITAHRDAIKAALPAARETRSRVGKDIAAAGLQTILPEEAPRR